MTISNAERAAILKVVELGSQFGYGNLISHLRTAWAENLMNSYGFTEQQAASSAHGGSAYPIAMHRDLLDHGEWDETGERYAKKPSKDAKGGKV